MTNQKMIPGSENAFTFKTLADAFLLRNHMIERFERADVEPDPERKRRLLTFVVIGGGLVGVELFGELTAFVDEIAPLYRHVSRETVRFLLLQAGDRIMPEIDTKLADYGARVLGGRRGGGDPNPRPRAGHRAGQGPLAGRDDRGGDHCPGSRDCPEPGRGRPARGEGQTRAHRGRWDHALQEPPGGVGARRLCDRSPPPTVNLIRTWPSMPCERPRCWPATSMAVLNGRPPRPFVYDTLGMMGSLGHSRAFGQLLKLRVHGVLAWFVRRTYYLLQMPGWSRRLRIMIDWTFALLFRPDIVKISLDSETVSLLREAAAGAVPENGRTEASHGSGETVTGVSRLAPSCEDRREYVG